MEVGCFLLRDTLKLHSVSTCLLELCAHRVTNPKPQTPDQTLAELVAAALAELLILILRLHSPEEEIECFHSFFIEDLEESEARPFIIQTILDTLNNLSNGSLEDFDSPDSQPANQSRSAGR